MDEQIALTIIDAQAVSIVADEQGVGELANSYARQDIFAEYHQQCTRNTQRRQRAELALFARYLHEAGIERAPDDLYTQASAWRGITYGLVKGFVKWQLQQGYAIGSINVRLATIRKYCALALESGVIESTAMDLIKTVDGYSHKVGRNIDTDRKKQGIPTRRGYKKATPTKVSTHTARRLKKATVETDAPRLRMHDQDLDARDSLLMCLFIEHALRCSEVAALNVESFNLEERTVTVYREKTDTRDTYELMPRTYQAAKIYLAGKSSGPLFTGYQGKRISTRAINDRVRQLGKQEGIEGLSPHDLRHYWALDALKNGTSLNIVQAYGGWSSAAMPLHYAKISGVTHSGLRLSE
jgi:site-specific recombinase XerC